MFMCALWNSIFAMKEKYPFMKVSLIDNQIPILSFGSVKNITLYLAGFNASQWKGSIIALKFFDDMLKALKDKGCMNGVELHKAFGDKGIALIPCVCPKLMSGSEVDKLGSLPVAKYCSKNKVSDIFVIKSNGSQIFQCTPQGNDAVRTKQIGEVLSACCKMPLRHEGDRSEEARFCSWASRVLGVPAFSISMEAYKPSAIDRVYESKKEMLLISALI